MKKRIFTIALVVGIVLIAISLCMVVVSQIRAHMGADKSQQIVRKLQELLPPETTGVPGVSQNTGMPVLQIHGRDYVALLEIPSLEVILPVANEWDNDRLYESPARFCGSAYDNTMVIGGTDYSGQLSFCGEIEHGTVVNVTDMTGAKFTYQVSRIDRAGDADTRWLSHGDFDLTLYCRDTYSMEYIAVRCMITGR